MRRRLLAACAGAAALALAFAGGRLSVPRAVVERGGETQLQQSAVTSSDAIDWSLLDSLDIEEATTTKPDGTVTTRRRLKRRQEQKGAAKHEEAKLDIRFQDRWHEKLVIREAPRATWSLAARAGLRLDGSRVFGAVVERRLGPVWLGAWVDTTKAAGLSLRVEW